MIILFFLLVFAARILNAQEDLKSRLGVDEDSEVDFSAVSYEWKGDVFTGKEDVVLKSGEITLYSQEAVYNRKTNIAEVSGGIVLETGDDILRGESGTFDFNNQTGVINDARLYIKENNFFVKGDKIEKYGEDSYLVNDFKLTTCDGDKPEWSITGSQIKVTVEGYGSLRNGAFRVKDVPVAYVPYLLFPAKTERQSGVLIPQAGYSDRNGVEFEIPIFWAVSDSTDITFYERYISKRGLMQGLEMRYVSGLDSKGYFNFDILSDRIEEKNMSDPDQLELSPYERTNSGRYWLRGKADQDLSGGVKLRLDADVVSDQDYFREFEGGLSGFDTRPDYEDEFDRPFEEYNSPLRTSSLRLSKDAENYSFQVLSSYYQRPEGFRNDTTPEPLAGFNFSLLPTLIENNPVAFSMNSDYDYIWRDFGQKGHSFSISPRVSYPMWMGKYLQFETGFGYTHDIQWFDDDFSFGTDRQSRDVFYGEARLSTLLERVFKVDSKLAQKVKHKIVPSIAYEYRSHKDEDKYEPWYESIDDEGSANRVVFSIDNSLDAKKVDEKGNITYSQWGTFRLSQGYDITESRRGINPQLKKEPFEPLTAEMRFMPYSNLNFDAEARWDHYKDDFSYADLAVKYDVERADSRQDTYRLDYVYNDEGSKGLSYYVKVNLARGFALGSALQRDIEASHDVEKSYWLEYNSKCWGLKLGMQQYDEESRVMVSFKLFGFSY